MGDLGTDCHKRISLSGVTVPHPPAASPAPVQDRALLPDVLRGVALLGILTVNMQDFAGYREWTQHGLDRAAQVLIDVFANGRFISIFAMLFGWGAYGIYQRHGLRIFTRRHLLLLLIGTLHYLLFWHGDIISTYAGLALLIPLLARLQTRPLLWLGMGLGAWWLLINALSAFAFGTEARFSGLPTPSELQSYVAAVAARGSDFAGGYMAGLLFNGPWLLLLFILGMVAAREGVFSHPQRFGWLFRRFVGVALPLGLLLGAVLAYLNTRPDAFSGVLVPPVRMLGGLLGALGYVGILGLLLNRGALAGFKVFAATGRTALTNYLLQTLVMTTIFYPYAGAQWEKWGAAPALALALFLGVLQIVLSQWWLRSHARGPVEEWLRRMVYMGH